MDIKYIPREENIVTGAIYQLPNNKPQQTIHELICTTYIVSAKYNIQDSPEDQFPLYTLN